MTIKIKAFVSELRHDCTVDTEDDLGYSIEDWKLLSEENKKSVIQEYLDELPTQPYWILENINK